MRVDRRPLAEEPSLRSQWYAIASVTQLQTQPRAVRLLGEDLVVWRSPEGPAAAYDRCPHREAPLSEGWLDDGLLTCPYHGWAFDGSGACARLPAARAGVPFPPRARLDRVDTVERYGLVWARLAEGAPSATLPVIPEDDDPAYRRINVAVEPWRVSVGRMVDNFLDFAHFPWVHRGTIGAATDPVVPHLTLGPLGDFTGFAYRVETSNDDVGATATRLQTATVARSMTTGWSLPFLVRSDIAYDTGLRHVLLLVSTPVGEEESLFTFVVWRNDDHPVPAEEVIALDRRIAEEDRLMLERLRGPLPLDATSLVSSQADKASVEWRRQLRQLLDAGHA